MSSGISYAALFKKPILFIITNEHYKNISLIQYTKSISNYFKSELINIDLKKKFIINLKLSDYTLAKYENYKNEYLIYERYKKLSNSQLLIKLLK